MSADDRDEARAENARDASPSPGDADASIPTAHVAREASLGWMGLLPLAALALALWLAWRSVDGMTITVRAPEGHGIEVGDGLRHRGIRVGEVREVRLEEDLSNVVIEVALEPGAEPLAREGSRFYVVRPHLTLDSIQGLETVVGARYLAVVPGAPRAPVCTDFLALAEPPIEESVDPQGLTVVLEAPRRLNLAAGAPITFRDVRIGTVLEVALASDAASVEARAYVRPAYRELVRDNSRFWLVGGIEIDAGWVRGVRIEIDSLRSLVVSGVAVATPDPPGDAASAEQRFELHDGAQSEWLGWRTPLPVGEDARGGGLPTLWRAELRWRTGFMSRTKKRSGWLLAAPGGLFGPADLLGADRTDKWRKVELRVPGLGLAFDPLEPSSDAGIGFVAVDGLTADRWPTRRVAQASGPVDGWLVAGDGRKLPCDAGRWRVDENGAWLPTEALPQDELWNGACLVERPSGQLVALLLGDEETLRAQPLTGNVWPR